MQINTYTEPFTYWVIKNYFPNILVKQAAKFPQIDDFNSVFNNEKEKKFGLNKPEKMTDAQRQIINHMNNSEFLEFLYKTTGFKVIPDHDLLGAGLHAIPKDGVLKIHIDFNKHPKNGYRRKLNVLLYLNENWKEEWEGNLELHGDTIARIKPELNTMVIFETNETSWHGHPIPLACPEGTYRKSIALYYYDPAEIPSNTHCTVYK